MPSAFAHVAPALAMVPAFSAPAAPRRLWLLGALCAVLPDADVAGFAFGIPYASMLGHRGFTHSIAFAAALAALVSAAAFRSGGYPRGRAFAYLFLATASHGLLDACTNGGLGVAFLAPFDGTRFFAPFRPIEVSPLGVAAFLSERGALIVLNEVLWVGTPSVAFAFAASRWRRARAAG